LDIIACKDINHSVVIIIHNLGVKATDSLKLKRSLRPAHQTVSFDALSFLINKMLQPVTQTRRSGMDAGIQSQGCKILSGIAVESRHSGAVLLSSMALVTGIHAGMTARAEASYSSGFKLTLWAIKPFFSSRIKRASAVMKPLPPVHVR
jgi:hypothetical protein